MTIIKEFIIASICCLKLNTKRSNKPMSNVQSVTLEQCAEMREDCKKYIDKADALKRLVNNADFKLVFIEGYVKDYAARLVGLLGEQNLNLAGNKALEREEIMESLHGVARFQTYMNNVYRLANQAVNQLENITEAENECLKSYDIVEQ